MNKPGALYWYKAIVRQITDGDTCTVDIDAGFKTWRIGEKIRLNGIAAPELKQPGGSASAMHLRGLVDNKQVVIRTIKDRREKYGRMLAEIWLPVGDGWLNVNAQMVLDGHARYGTTIG